MHLYMNLYFGTTRLLMLMKSLYLVFFGGIMIVKFVLANIFESESITLQSTLRSVLISIDLVVIVYLFVLRVDLESEELSNRFLQFVLMILYCLFYHVRGRLRAHKNVSPVPFLCVCLKLQSCTPEDVYLCPQYSVLFGFCIDVIEQAVGYVFLIVPLLSYGVLKFTGMNFDHL